MSSSLYDRYKSQSDELPGLIKQVSQSLQHLAEVVYGQLPFAQAEGESKEAYHTRLIDYFEKLHAAQIKVFRELPDQAQHELGQSMAEQDIAFAAIKNQIERGEL